ncbi:MAG: endonuclease domain-containing protein [Clostridia bacterium]|nr:endonuclease domain-containing protein [Clostridia bacterium]
MSIAHNKKLVKNAQTLRKNMTDEEKHLWYDFLKKLPFTVNRQKNIGNYIVDFYIHSKGIVIELDGSQHFEEEHEKSDKKRDTELNKLGLRVIRYTNDDIKKHFYDICTELAEIFDINIDDIQIEEA